MILAIAKGLFISPSYLWNSTKMRYSLLNQRTLSRTPAQGFFWIFLNFLNCQTRCKSMIKARDLRAWVGGRPWVSSSTIGVGECHYGSFCCTVVSRRCDPIIKPAAILILLAEVLSRWQVYIQRTLLGICLREYGHGWHDIATHWKPTISSQLATSCWFLTESIHCIHSLWG